MALTLNYFFTGVEIGTLSFGVNTMMIIFQIALRKKTQHGINSSNPVNYSNLDSY